ncbi:DUF1007 family protein [Arcobacter sp.]|uniref:DUF1007 family protein n=1 Tax=unclassified Arcobacter TaxID=2593671 RepID=UPI003AFFA05D
MKKLLSLIFLYNIAFAHPHYFIDVDLKINENKIYHQWQFDRINSKILLFNFDKNRNNIFEKNESIDFYKTILTPIKKDNFHLFIDSNTIEYKFKKLNDFKISYTNKRLTINFTTELQSLKETTICTIDPSVYMAFKLNSVDTTLKIQTQKSEYDFCIGTI